MLNKQALSSKLAIFSLLALLGFFGQIKYKQWQSQKAIDKQRQTLQAQADELQKENEDLNESLKYLNSPAFKERVARQQLGLKKDGENVYSFSESAGQPEILGAETSKKELNISKWWNYFFKD